MPHDDPLHVSDDGSSPAELELLRQRLLADGAEWRVEFAASAAFLRQVEEFGRAAAQRELAATYPDAFEHDTTIHDRWEMMMYATSTEDTAPDPQARSPRRTPHPQARSPRRTPHPRRVARWVGQIAALLIVALLAGLFLMQRARIGPLAQPTASSAPQRACASSEITASLPTYSALTDVAMTGPVSGWAVGAVADAEIGPTTRHALLLQFDQCRWQPIDFTLPDASLMSIAMDSDRAGWAAGAQGNAPLLLNFGHNAWSRVTPSGDGGVHTGAHVSYTAVRTLEPGAEVWVVEVAQGDPTTPPVVTLLHLVGGGGWTRVPTPYQTIADLVPVGRDDIWLIGDMWSARGNSQRLAHYRAGALVDETPIAPDMARLGHLRMFAPDDGWATGAAPASASELGNGPLDTRPVALHYDGVRWMETAIGAPPVVSDLVMMGPGEAWSYTSELTSSSGPARVVATQRQHGGHWQSVPIDGPDVVGIDLAHIACVTTDDCWVDGLYRVPDTTRSDGHGGTIVVQGVAPLLLHFAGGAWRQYGRAT